MRQLKFLSFGLIFLLFANCGSTKSMNPVDLLKRNNWILSSLSGDSLDMGQFVGGIPTLNFLDDGKLSGFSGCNNFSGNFILENTGIKLNPGAMTKKMCPGSGEQDFISALGKVGDLQIATNKLILLDGATELMSFVPKKR